MTHTDHKCEGNCDKHVGEVKPVHVTGFFKDWGQYYYCEHAIKIDEMAGFTVTPVPKECTTR